MKDWICQKMILMFTGSPIFQLRNLWRSVLKNKFNSKLKKYILKINISSDDTIKNIVENLEFDDIINLKNLGEIGNFSDIELRKVLSKKLLHIIMKIYSIEYPNYDIFNDNKLKNLTSKFCLSCILLEFSFDITLEQVEQMISVLSLEQQIKIKEQTLKGGWY